MRRHPLLLAVTASALLATACGPHKDLALDLRSVSITVPRLITPAVQLVPPAPAPLPASLPSIPPPVTFLPPAPSTQVAPPTPPTAPACRSASPFAVPAVPASQLVEAPPAPDAFKQFSLTRFTAGGKKGEANPLQDVVITALPKALTSVGQAVDAYRVVRTDPISKTSSVEVYQLVHPSDLPSAISPGIYLVGLAWKDAVRGELSFQPSGNGLFLLPSPVEVAASGTPQYVGSATDPETLTTLTLTRNVTGRKRVNACGELIDTFTVELTGALVTPALSRQVAWTQQLATSYGGVDVEDHLRLSSVDGFSWERLTRNTSVPKETR
jgi:hypothetical protein